MTPAGTVPPHENAVIGSLLGTAVGDALGLPYEGLAPERARRMLGEPDRYRLIFRRGMISDDTEHSCMALQALLRAENDDRLAREFGKLLVRWLVMVPAGAGMATARAGLKLAVGISPSASGVASAGNGPAMRAAVLGAAIAELDRLPRVVRSLTRLTHTDSRAEQGALAVAIAASHARSVAHPTSDSYFAMLERFIPREDSSREFHTNCEQVQESLGRGERTEEFARRTCGARGVSGYVLQTVPVALHAWLSHPRDLSMALPAIIRCGGDTDSTGAIVGGLVGTGTGPEGIPEAWLDGLWEWPRSVAWMRELARRAARAESQDSAPCPSLSPLAVLPRNAVFLSIVLVHGFRRLLPPY